MIIVWVSKYKRSWTGHLKTTDIYFFHGFGDQKSKFKLSVVLVPSGGSGGSPFCASLQLLVAARYPWHPSACGCTLNCFCLHTAFSLCVYLFLLLFCVLENSHHWIQDHPTPRMISPGEPYFNQSERCLFQIRLHSQVLGIYIFWASPTIEITTINVLIP